MKNINSILIANRGEIASRIIRTCRKMGIRSIAVFSEADRNSLFVEEADTAIFIGKSNPSASYLDQDKIIDAAKTNKADAIHPGYGFLSENVNFAKICKKEGIIFIGPNVEAIDAMGSKSKAKTLMQKNKIPIVSGYQGEDQSIERLKKEALKIGFPLLLKATAGGGGKGMRIVHKKEELEKAIDAAKRESLNAFGNDELIIEKYITSGRHIEFQIFGDQHGNIIHILERECSIQRRYQKIIEESPSPVMNDALRKEMGAVAVNAAKALNYDNAGTVEFIFDDKTRDFYFLEVNTRLQVEHPVTEAITGLDLVQLQIESAQGMPLNLKQDDIQAKGYAIEARLYAEDPSNDFLPVTGTIDKFKFPQVDGLRMEAAIRSGSEISIFYDPMIAKIIIHDASRIGAHRKMRYFLKNLICQGIVSNQDFLLHLLENSDFQKGEYDTHFLDKKIDLKNIANKNKQAIHIASIVATLFDWYKRNQKRTLLKSMPSGWRNNFNDYQFEVFNFKENEFKVEYRFIPQKNQFGFKISESIYYVNLISGSKNHIKIEMENIQHHFNISKNKKTIHLHNEEFGNITLLQKDRFPINIVEKIAGGYEAPMPSQIIKVLVKQGQKVESGDGLVILSSMKMENTIEADVAGIVEEIYVEEGSSVDAGFLLLKLN